MWLEILYFLIVGSRLMKFDSVGINKNCVNGKKKKSKEKLIIIKRNKEGVMDYEKLR